MGTVVVDVMLKPEILDPQGQAVAGALPRLGFGQFTAVRQGKRFALEVDGAVTPEVLDAARKAAEVLLSNPVIEDVVSVRADDAPEQLPSAATLAGYDWDDDELPDHWGANDHVAEGDVRRESTPVPAYRRPVSIEDFDALPGTGAYHGDEDDD
ncbi:MAG: phosphoribosylformylglycinamidine synthase subunit PurS [Austwickia sp.]|jgi:phosphoribosylformylglycinamidine synthase subunit PurS|nr:MAG: phosphoribosylformylglycinamidine synthase subunit PurS [Austwickia sp.]